MGPDCVGEHIRNVLVAGCAAWQRVISTRAGSKPGPLTGSARASASASAHSRPSSNLRPERDGISLQVVRTFRPAATVLLVRSQEGPKLQTGRPSPGVPSLWVLRNSAPHCLMVTKITITLMAEDSRDYSLLSSSTKWIADKHAINISENFTDSHFAPHVLYLPRPKWSEGYGT